MSVDSAGSYPISRLLLRCVLWIALGLTFITTSACMQLEECPGTDITCSANGWLLYLQAVNATNPTPALCSAGTAGAAFFTYIGGGGSGAESIVDVCATRDGGTVMAGSATADIPTLNGKTPNIAYTGSTDALIVKLDAGGAVEWYSFAGSAGDVYAFQGVTETSDGGFIAVGEAHEALATLGGKAPIVPYQSVAPDQDGFVARFDSAGALLWWSFIGATISSNDELSSVVELSGGGFVVGGNMDSLTGMPVSNLSTHSGGFDNTFVKFKDPGIIEWYLSVGSANNEQTREIIATADGGFIATGITLGTFINVGGQIPRLAYSAATDFFVLKVSAVGVLEWHTFLGATGVQEGDGVTELADGSLVVAGRNTGPVATLDGKAPLVAHDNNDTWLVRLSATGIVEWHTHLPSPTNEIFGHIAAMNDGGFMISAEAAADIPSIGGLTPLNAYAGGAGDILLARYTADGTLSWYSFVGGTGNDKGLGLAATRDGGFIMSGQVQSNIGGLGSLTPILAYDNSFDGFILRGGVDGPY